MRSIRKTDTVCRCSPNPTGSLAAYKKALALQRALHTHVAAAEEAAAAERREHRQAKEGRAPTEVRGGHPRVERSGWAVDGRRR